MTNGAALRTMSVTWCQTANVNGAIKCQQISGGDGYSTMADGTQTFMFSFGPLSGLADIAAGKPGTQFPNVFNTVYSGHTDARRSCHDGRSRVTPASYTAGAPTVQLERRGGSDSRSWTPSATARCASPCLDGHVDPRQIMDVGVMNGNIPAPLIAFDEDDEFFLTLTNVGMIMRPDLFEQHTIHFHGYPNASSFYDGVPDASVAINIGGSFTYYYLAPDAGTYFWHCHITPPEHLQMGMVGQLYVRPRQNRVPSGDSLYTLSRLPERNRPAGQHGAICAPRAIPPPTSCAARPCRPSTPASTQGLDKLGNPQKYVYNDGDGSTATTSSTPSRSTASIPTSILSA